MRQKPIIIAGGGTGGHMFPALSLQNELVHIGYPVILLTDHRGAAYPPFQAVTRLNLHVLSFKRTSLWRFILSLTKNFFYCLGWFLHKNPSLVVSLGGYTSAPPTIAAQLLGIPTIIHEQNAVLGKAHRWSSHFVRLVATSFLNVKHLPLRIPHVLTGNPVRPTIAALINTAYALPQANDPFQILIIGGSQGAKIFAEVVPEAIVALEAPWQITITQQCRADQVERTQSFYKHHGIQASVQPFFPDMDIHYNNAHLIIARSGGATVAELTIAGKPAILVPFAAAADNHQQANAEQLEKNGGVWVMLEKDFNPTHLKKILTSILKNPNILIDKSARLRKLAKPDAALALTSIITDFLSTQQAKGKL
jgi:UDP-N-acetylglucosamine--N-acetylmuramyl-(pentapeptide) pyrophosphoryl-undecaprenol N-acetylglucosamine transferase